MIKKFDDLKKQLTEISEVVNSFKSEAVQLKVLDLLSGAQTGRGKKGEAFEAVEKEIPTAKKAEKEVKTRRRGRKAKAVEEIKEEKPKKRRGRAPKQAAEEEAVKVTVIKRGRKLKGKGKRGRIPSGQGASATVVRLMDGDFFNIPRTINDIIDYCETFLGKKFKQTDVSGKLGRLVKEGLLLRDKGEDGLFSYRKPL